MNNFHLESNLGIRMLTNYSSSATAADLNTIDYKSPNEAFLYSFAIPGMGQLYIGAKYGYIYTAAEIALLTTYFLMRNNATNIRDDYRQVVRDNVSFIGPGSFENWDPIEDYEHATQYETWSNPYSGDDNEAGRKTIERTGKWYWSDMDPEYKNTKHGDIPEGAGSRKYRIEAYDLRQKANDTFKSARTILGIVIMNHVVSAIEARISTKRWNMKQAESDGFQLDVQTDISDGNFSSALVLRKSF